MSFICKYIVKNIITNSIINIPEKMDVLKRQK